MSIGRIDLQPSVVLWLTGLSGAGKSTIGSAVVDELRRRGIATEYLDGDAVRRFSPAGFSRDDRDAHVKRVGFLASRLEHHGITVVCALISPYADARKYVRGLCRRFVEIYVATPLTECERRDPKGLYKRARRGEITQFTGIDDPYEPPTDPELVLNTLNMSVNEAVHASLAAHGRAVRAEGGSSASIESIVMPDTGARVTSA
jgi:adenylylsulfate kinase